MPEPKRLKTVRLAAALVGLCALITLALATGCASVQEATTHDVGAYNAAETQPRNVILLIGDGMGVSQITAAHIELGPLNMERLPVGGLVMTFAGNRLVTDSAASGTAIATGHKTRNGAVSVTPDGKPLKTVLEYAEEQGKATGLVVTCALPHATPAAFAAHVESRDNYLGIAKQMVGSGVDVLFGGGWSYFVPNSEPGGSRKDGINLLDTLSERMPVVMTVEDFRDLPETDAAAAFFYPEHPPAAETREPGLAELTEKALEILSKDEDGFFLMVEGSQIDWAGHENDHDWLIDEMADFDGAVGVAASFAERDGSTLVVVTADHETGAYAVLDGSLEKHSVTRPSFGSGDHSAAMVPLLAYGPGSETLGGISDNADLGQALIGFVSETVH
jgi:alkaline phosphatase